MQARDTGEAELRLAVVPHRAEVAGHRDASQRARAGAAVAYISRNVRDAPSKRGPRRNSLRTSQNFKSAPDTNSANANWPQRCASSIPLIVGPWKKLAVVRKQRARRRLRDSARSTKECGT